MCGIFGVIYRDEQFQAQAERMVRARDTLTHRGPDEHGLWIQPGAAFAHRRLKILDLTRGQQPMTTPDDRYALTYNGEIYNFRDIRQTLQAEHNETFESQGDTEVLFKALNHWNEAALDHLNGMFAFGHYDRVERALMLVRDRLGQKPLYYLFDDEKLIFASELKALLDYADQQFALDPVAVDQFFTRGYVLSPRTIFQGICKLPPACRLKLDANNWQVDVRPYWDVEHISTPSNDQQVLDELETLLADAIRLRMISDVPIGCLLSGGIDSSLITALAAKVTDTPVQAFSIAFDESEAHNELPYATMVAEHCGAQLHARQVRSDDFAHALETTAACFDEPYGNFTMFPMRMLSQLAREKMTVVLSGQGGDELTAGYAGRYNWVIQSQTPAGDKPNRLQFSPPVDDMIQHLNHSSFVPWPGAREQILSEAIKADICAAASPFDDLADSWRTARRRDRLNRVLYTDVKTNLPDYLVCLEERMSMSCSLEARNPFLDYRVVNYLMSLPPSLKVRNGENKWILKELAYRHVPRQAIDRPKKGFTPPLHLWIENNVELVRSIFEQTDAQTAGLYSPAWRQHLLQGEYKPNTLMPVFYSLMFAVWVRNYGRYVSHWPQAEQADTPAAQSVSSFLTPATPAAAPAKRDSASIIENNPWQATLRQQSQHAVTAARWFTQALQNFPEKSALFITGDDTGWYEHLSTEYGFEITRQHQATGLVIIGLPALVSTISTLVKEKAATPAQQAVCFVPFDAGGQDQLQYTLQAVNQQLRIAGSQVVPVSQTQAVLIARFDLTELQRPLQQVL